MPFPYSATPKYGNKKITVDGIKFDSRKEALIYQQLIRAKGVKKVEVHKAFLLQEGFRYKGKAHRAINIEPDFVVHWDDGRKEIWEVKGGKATQTDAWKIKWKMFLWKYKNEFSDFLIM